MKLNNEGETPKQEKTEPKETRAEKNAEIKAYAATKKPQATKHSHDLKPGERMPNEHLFKK